MRDIHEKLRKKQAEKAQFRQINAEQLSQRCPSS